VGQSAGSRLAATASQKNLIEWEVEVWEGGGPGGGPGVRNDFIFV